MKLFNIRYAFVNTSSNDISEVHIYQIYRRNITQAMKMFMTEINAYRDPNEELRILEISNR